MHGILPPFLLAAVLLQCACGPAPRREAMPYRFRQSLLDSTGGEPLAPGRKPSAPQTKVRRASLGRCQALEGRPFAGDPRQATRRLLSAILGRQISDRLLARAAQRVDRARRPRPGDLVFLRTDSAIPVGVVTRRSGPRVTFVRLLGGRARCGRLHLHQPHRRRLPGQAGVANSFMRVKRPTDPPNTRYLAGELLAGFAPAPL